MILPYQKILDELKKGKRTLQELDDINKPGDTVESVRCLVARGLVKFTGCGYYELDAEAMRRETER